MKRVALIHKDGRVLRTYEIDFPGLKYVPADHWYLEQARENAIKDNLVDRDKAGQLSCRFVDDLGEGETSEHPAAQASFFTRKGVDPAATKRHDDTDQSRSEAPDLEHGRTGRSAKTVAWAVVIIAVIVGAIGLAIYLYRLAS